VAAPLSCSSSDYVAVVRRGRGELFAALCLAEAGVDVVWDRRRADRRCRAESVLGERRAGQRRGAPPPSWGWPGLVILEAPAEGAKPPAAARQRILIVEDDPRVREVLHQALAGAGYEVVATRDGEEALAVYAATPADLIITDLLMPRKDGVETIRGLRRQHPDARVIAVTGARGRFNRLTAARHLGAHHTLVKPFNLRDLLTTVRDVLTR
jgi:CheY-like chemotaxis protein